jgi:hypothetical protein
LTPRKQDTLPVWPGSGTLSLPGHTDEQRALRNRIARDITHGLKISHRFPRRPQLKAATPATFTPAKH